MEHLNQKSVSVALMTAYLFFIFIYIYIFIFIFQESFPAAPKMFAFDGLFTDEDVQSDVASSALMESIHGVVSGVDGCLFAFGHASLGKRIFI